MASGDLLATFFPRDNEPPSSNYATLGVRNGRLVLQFDDTTSWVAIFTNVLGRTYAGGGITVYVHWTAVAITNTVGWLVAIERGNDGNHDFDTDAFASNATIVAATVDGTSGKAKTTSIGITSGANMDSLAAGEYFRIKVARDVANDTAVGNAEIECVEIRET